MKKTNKSKLKQADYVHVLRHEADHQGKKIFFTEIRWIGLYIAEKSLLNKNNLEQKIETDKAQVLHRMRLRQFLTRQKILDIEITPQEWELDPEIIIKHDDLYAKAWECEYEKPIFDNDHNNAAIPNSPEVRYNLI